MVKDMHNEKTYKNEMLECPNNRIMQEDIEDIVCTFPYSEKLRGKSVLVTGATGLIGVQIVKTLACMKRLKEMDMHIIAFARNEKKAMNLLGNLKERGDVEIVIGDINAVSKVTQKVDYIIHGASATSSKYFVTNPVETIQTALVGTTNILEVAREKNVEGMVYLSSLEVYGTPRQEMDKITESDYGYIDPLSVRSSYSEGKRMVECICASYAKEYKVPVKIARLSQTFGPGVDYKDGRVFAEFARCAVEQRNIVLHTEGKTVRTYCYVKDAVSALLYILLCGETGSAYNVTNMDTAVSIREMAEMVCHTIGKDKIETVVQIPEDISLFGYNPEMKIRLDSSRLQALGWKATVGLEEMYQRMIAGFLIY